MQFNAGEQTKLDYKMKQKSFFQCHIFKYDAWFMLGSAAFRSEKWETAIRAFRSCTNLDPDVRFYIFLIARCSILKKP